MAGNSAFDKRYIEPKKKSQVEGLLEHFNLPPKTIDFLIDNMVPVVTVLVVVIVGIVAYSIYGSYRAKKHESGASALALAMQKSGSARTDALQKVVKEYSGTTSGTWARIDLANQSMQDKDYAKAADLYAKVNSELSAENPLFALSLYGLAQAREAGAKYDDAYSAYEKLKSQAGYRLIGYDGMARALEAQGKKEKALGIYGQYLAELGDSPANAQKKREVEQKIANLKAQP